MHTCCSTDKPSCKAKCFKIAVIVIAGIAALGWVIMLLWNCLLPDLFVGVKPIGYWQALGILLLSKILFGGFHGHGRWKAHHRHWESMSPEEREQMKARFKSRWGHCCSDKAEDKPESGTTAHGE